MVRNALMLVVLMLAACFLPALPVHLEDDAFPAAATWTASESTFNDGATNHSAALCPGCSGAADYANVAGAGLASGSVDAVLEPVQVGQQDGFSVAGGSLTGIPTNMSVTSAGLVLTTTLGGPPQSGNTSQQVSTSVQWSGVKAFDSLHLVCNGSVCGSITGTNLTIVARELILEAGTSISVSGASTSGSGAGTSTTTPSNGRSDGAGGGGHGGSGGSGGGSSGGSGGSTYGNGTETGSPGGDVSGNSYYGDAYGGNGGGLLTVRTSSLIVNGSLLAEGNDGDAGVNPSSGTGAGGSGAGGGSGGSIDIKTNTLSMAASGTISANGGDGGDGKDGQQSGVGFGMYDGGDGGGGGGGGYVNILTTSGGATLQGTVSANGGGGGLKGLKYGTGIDGVDGSAGSTGTVTSGHWSGYASGSYAASNGVFLGDAMAFPSARGPLWMNHSATVPSNSTLEVMARTSMSPPGTANPTWSAWRIVPLSNATLDRATFLQVAYAMTRNGTASPVVTGFDLDWSAWTTVDGLSFSLDGQAVAFPSDASLTTSSATLDLGNAEVVFSIPDDATPVGDGRLFLAWTPTNASLMVEHGSLGVLMDLDTDDLYGQDLVLTQAQLSSMLTSASLRTASDGRVWRDVTLDLASTTALGDLGLSVQHVAIPWSMEARLDLASATNASIQQHCGGVYLSTTCTTLSSHGLSYATGAGTDQNARLELRNLALTWIDDEPPRLERVLHRYGGVDMPAVRLGEQTAIVVEDYIDESSATVELWMAPTIGNQAEGVSAAWNAAMGGWVALIDTLDHVQEPGSLSVSLRMTDARGNVAIEEAAYAFNVLDSMPEVAALTVTTTDATLLEGGLLDGVWEGDGATFTFALTDAGNRSDLVASFELVSNDDTTVLEGAWNEGAQAYTATWSPLRSDLGAWDLEARLSEPGPSGASDVDGFQAGADGTFRLVDRTSPGGLVIEAPAELVLGDDLDLVARWSLGVDEEARPTVEVRGPNGVIVAEADPGFATTESLSLTVLAEDLVEGVHRVVLNVEDRDGNLAGPVEVNVTVVEAVGVFGDVTLGLAEFTELTVAWDFLSDQPAARLTVSLNGSEVHEEAVTEGEGQVTLDLLTVGAEMLASGAMSAVVEAKLCHLDQAMCLTNSTLVDLTELQQLGLEGSCLTATPDGNASDLLVCQIRNDGWRPVTLRWETVTDGPGDGWELTLQPGAERALWEANPAFTRWNSVDRATQPWSVAWTLTAFHDNGPLHVILEGNHNFDPPRVEDEGGTDQSTLDDGLEGGRSGMLWVGLGVAGLLSLAGATFALTRRGGTTRPAEMKTWSEPTEPGTLDHQPEEPASHEEQEPSEDPEAVAYHDGLIEQGYSPEDARTYTQQYFPGFRT